MCQYIKYSLTQHCCRKDEMNTSVCRGSKWNECEVVKQVLLVCALCHLHFRHHKRDSAADKNQVEQHSLQNKYMHKQFALHLVVLVQ